MRHRAVLFRPAPKQLSSAKMSPLNGSTEISPGQVSPDAMVRATLPLVVLICTTTPLVKLPPLWLTPPYRLPWLSIATLSRPGRALLLLVRRVLEFATPPPG